MPYKPHFIISVLLCFSNYLQSQPAFPGPVYPMHVIFDTDFGPDYDDVGAIALLHGFADSGYIKILATMASSKHENAAAAINVFNTYVGEFATSMEMAGASISLLKLDEELKRLLSKPANSPFFLSSAIKLGQ